MTFFDHINVRLERMFGTLAHERHPWLHVVFYTLLLHSFLVFTAWRDAGILTHAHVTANTYTCWPYFLSCDIFYVFSDMPFGYSFGLLYATLGALLVLAGYFGVRGRWGIAFGLFSITVLFRFFVVYIGTFEVPTNYNTLALFVSVILLFSKDKAYALKVFVTLFYFVTLLYRFHPGYLTGTTFTSLSLGIPLIPHTFTQYIGVLFILLIGVAPILLWGTNFFLRRLGALLLGAFHVLTITLVGFIYPLLSIPLLILVYHVRDSFSFSRIRTSPLLSVLLIIMIVGQCIPLLIPGDHRLTGEGTKFGFYMFDANHQCSGYLEQTTKTGEHVLTPYSVGSGMGICDPYLLWFRGRSLCRDKDTVSVMAYFMHSINGDPYRKLIDLPNICTEEYRLFRHNEWIRTDRVLPHAPEKNALLPNAP